MSKISKNHNFELRRTATIDHEGIKRVVWFYFYRNTTDTLELVLGQQEVRLQRNIEFPTEEDNCAHPPCIGLTIGRVENRKCWKITKPQVAPIDAHKNKTICMI